MAALAVAALGGGACLDGGAQMTTDPDQIDARCHGPTLTIDACDVATISEKPETSARHIRNDIPIIYSDVPPSSGDHRASWARWGEYSYLPPQRWVHNLEHGGVALLYDPCAPPELVADLRAFARARPDDETGAFRYILTPFPGLPQPVAAVAWEWTWLGDCVDRSALSAFIDAHYRQAPEDFAVDGSYARGWISR